MKRSWSKKCVAALVLLTSALSASSSAVWYCEGRACGTTLSDCCCSQDSASCDLPPELHNAIHTSNTPGCRSKCACVMVEKALDQNLPARHPIRGVEAPVADLPLIPVPQVVFYEGAIGDIETRGPPVRCILLPPLGLRAPPAA